MLQDQENPKQKMADKDIYFETARQVIDIEAEAIISLKSRINENFAKACEMLLHCKGRIIVTGIGKSGHIANKIAATFASTGTPAFFVHPAEANHGDMGMIAAGDVILALSNSGETRELLTLLPLIKYFKIPLIVMTGNLHSKLAQSADVILDTAVAEEACPLGLAPTSSTTASLVMGDALAISLLKARGFTVEDFALFHPGGSLGKRLLLRIRDIMRTGDAIPRVAIDAGLDQALIEMTRKSLGMTTITDKEGRLLGIYTDGDLRRSLSKGLDVHQTRIADVMTKEVKSAPQEMLAVDALRLMETYKITVLTIVDSQEHLIGVLHMHDLLSHGLN